MVATGFSAMSLISYDYAYLLVSLPHYIREVEEVILGLDRFRRTWSGNSFSVPDQFFEDLEMIDTDKKIRIVEDDFYCPDLSPIENDTRERNFLSTCVKPGNWIISIDADEIATDVSLLKRFLSNLSDTNVMVTAPALLIFKQLSDSVLVARCMANAEAGFFPVATRAVDSFVLARVTRQPQLKCPMTLIHYSWGRSENDLYMKLKNWGHTNDFDVDSYFARWKELDGVNYELWKDFHPVNPHNWTNLVKINNNELAFVDALALSAPVDC